MPATASTTTSSAAGYLPGWNDASGRLDLPGTASAPAASAARR